MVELGFDGERIFLVTKQRCGRDRSSEQPSDFIQADHPLDRYTIELRATYDCGAWRRCITAPTEQPPWWIATSDLPVSPGHPFYTRLNALLDADGFDAFVEEACRTFYAPVLGRPSLAPGRYFRLLLVGYFEGIDSERASRGARRIRWRSGAFCDWASSRRHRIIRRFRGPVG